MSTGEVVTVTTSVKFGDVADTDLTIDADAQAAVRIGANNAFQVYAGPTPDWTNVYNDDLGAPDGDTEYAVAVRFDYTKQTYGVTVTKETILYVLTNDTGSTSFPLAKGASAMQKVSYLGAGSFVSIAGSYISAGYTANINAGTEITVATNVVVSQEFVSTYMGTVLAKDVSTQLTAARSEGNGLSYLNCYALGLNPDKESDKPIVNVTTDASGNFVFTVKHPVYDSEGKVTGYEDLTPADNVSLSVSLKYGTTTEVGTGTSAGASITPDEMFNQTGMSGSNVIYYKAQINATAK